MTTTARVSKEAAFVGVLLNNAPTLPKLADGRLDVARIYGVARKFCRLAARMRKLAEHACNRELTKAEEREDGRVDAAFKALCAEIGCRAYLSGDPRGLCAHIVFPNGAHNTWGGRECGWGVE